MVRNQALATIFCPILISKALFISYYGFMVFLCENMMILLKYRRGYNLLSQHSPGSPPTVSPSPVLGGSSFLEFPFNYRHIEFICVFRHICLASLSPLGHYVDFLLWQGPLLTTQRPCSSTAFSAGSNIISSLWWLLITLLRWLFTHGHYFLVSGLRANKNVLHTTF